MDDLGDAAGGHVGFWYVPLGGIGVGEVGGLVLKREVVDV